MKLLGKDCSREKNERGYNNNIDTKQTEMQSKHEHNILKIFFKGQTACTYLD